MSVDWPYVRLKDYCTKIGSGSTPRGGANVYLDSGNVCLIRSQNIYNDGFSENGLVFISNSDAEKLNNVEIELNDVLINITGDSVARVCLAPKDKLPARVNQHVAIIRTVKNELDPKFVRFFLTDKNTQNHLLMLAGTGATRNALTKGMLEEFLVPKPDILIQKKISKILSDLDDKIYLNNQINQTLESIAQAIFKSWFIDFEPVHAKITAKQEGKDPERAAMCAISGKTQTELEQIAKEDFAELQATAALFPDELVETELGDVPKGWEVKEASSIFNISIGKTPPRKEPYWFSNYSDDIKWLSIKDMGNNGLFTKETSEYLTHQAIAKFNIKVLPRNTVLLSFKLTVGRVVISNSEITTNEAIAHFFSDKIPYFWTYLYLRNFDFSKLGSTSSIATAINSKIIKDMPFLVVDTMILRVFEKNVSTFFETIRNNEVQNSNLMNVRDTLLPKLLSGEVSVEDIKQQQD